MAKGGRPRKIKSVRQFEERAEAYFRECEAKEEPVLLTGLILALELSSRIVSIFFVALLFAPLGILLGIVAVTKKQTARIILCNAFSITQSNCGGIKFWQTKTHIDMVTESREIGRASCRERV